MTALQITMVVACLAVVSCEPPVISPAYGVPSVDSYSPSYTSGGYGGGGGGGGYGGGHHGGHETVGRGGADSAPGLAGEVVSSGGSDSSGHTVKGSSPDEGTPCSSSGCTAGVERLGGSGSNVDHTEGDLLVHIAQEVPFNGVSIISDRVSGDKDSYGGSGVIGADSTVPPVPSLESDTTTSGVKEETISPWKEPANLTQLGPHSSESVGCTTGENCFSGSVSIENDGHDVDNETVQVNSALVTQTYKNVEGIPDTTHSSNIFVQNDESGWYGGEDRSVSGSEGRSYHREGASTSDNQGTGFTFFETSKNIKAGDLNDTHVYNFESPQPNNEISGNQPSVIQKDTPNSPNEGVLRCKNEETYLKVYNNYIHRADDGPSYNEDRPEQVIRSVDSDIQEANQDNVFSDANYIVSDVGTGAFDKSILKNQDYDQDHFAKNLDVKRIMDSNSNAGEVPRNETSDNTRYSTQLESGSGYVYSAPVQPWDGGGIGINTINDGEIPKDSYEVNGFLKSDHGIIQGQSEELPHIRSSERSAYASWLDSRQDRGIPVVTMHDEYVTNANNPENIQARSDCSLYEHLAKGSINEYQHKSLNMFRGSPMRDILDITSNLVGNKGNKEYSSLNEKSENTWKSLDSGGEGQPYSSAGNIIISDLKQYAPKFKNYVSGSYTPMETSLRGHFILADVQSPRDPLSKSHLNTSDTLRYGIQSRQVREGTSSWIVPHPNDFLKPNAFLEPPTLTNSEFIPNPGIGVHAGYGIEGYKVSKGDGIDESVRKQGESLASNSNNNNYNSQGGQIFSETREHDSSGPQYGGVQSTTRKYNTYGQHATIGSLRNVYQQGLADSEEYSAGGVAQTSIITGDRTKIGSGEYTNQQGVGVISNKDVLSPIGNGLSELVGHGYGSGGVSQNHIYHQGSNLAIGEQTTLQTGGNQGYSDVGVVDTSISGVHGQQDKIGSSGYATEFGVSYSSDTAYNIPINIQPPHKPGDPYHNIYGPEGRAYTSSSGVTKEQSSSNSRGYLNERGEVFNYNQGPTQADNQRSPETNGYWGYSSGGVAETPSSGVYKHQAAVGSNGYTTKQGVGYTYNKNPYAPLSNQPPLVPGVYWRYGSTEAAPTSSPGVIRKQTATSSRGYVNHQDVGVNYNHGFNTQLGEKPSLESDGYQGYNSGSAETYSSEVYGKQSNVDSSGYTSQKGTGYTTNQGPGTPISNQPPLATGWGYRSTEEAPTSNSGAIRQRTATSSGGYVNHQEEGLGHSQGSIAPLGNKPSPGTGWYKGYGIGNAGVSSPAVFGQKDVIGSSGYAIQGTEYSSNQGLGTPINNQPNLATGNYWGYGSTEGAHISSSGVARQQTATSPGGYADHQEVGLSHSNGSIAPLGKKPSPGTGWYQGYGTGRAEETSFAVFGQQAVVGSTDYATQQGIGYSSNQVSYYTPTSNQHSITNDYRGFGSTKVDHTSRSGVSREHNYAGSRGSVNQQGVWIKYDQGANTQIGKQPGSGGYEGYGTAGVSQTSSYGGYETQARTGTAGVVNQQGVSYSSSHDYSSPSENNYPSQRTGINQWHGKGGNSQSSNYPINQEHTTFVSGVYENKHRVDNKPSKSLENSNPGNGRYPEYGISGLSGLSETFGSGNFNNKYEVGYSSTGNIYNIKEQNPVTGAGTATGYGAGGNGGGYGTVWKEVGGWKNFTVRPAGFLGHGLSGKPYQFGYSVKDHHTGADFRQQEQSDGNTVKGQYRVALPDGRTQIVTYTADWQTGFHADVQYEGEASYPAVWGGSGGHTSSGSYGVPSTNYGAPSSSYGAPSSSYGAPAGGTGSQYNNIGHSTGGYGGHSGYRK